jgi:hypothetical protein
MRTPRRVDGLWLEATCADIKLPQWERWMAGATRADKRRIDGLVKRHLHGLYRDLALNLRNPYHYYKTRRHLILVHSATEYFLSYGRG